MSAVRALLEPVAASLEPLAPYLKPAEPYVEAASVWASAQYADVTGNSATVALLTDLGWQCGFWAALCFVVSTITSNYSQVDKLWSLVPAFYSWYITYDAFERDGELNQRSFLVSLLISAWAARLTYNFARRDGYKWPPWRGDEDYRWAILRQFPVLNTWLGWAAFNLSFISAYQHALLLLIVFPQTLLVRAGAPTNVDMCWDVTLAAVFLALVGVEYVADQQQFDYQTEKYRLKNAGLERYGEFGTGFLRTGLWSMSRHPNYAVEQTIWVIMYLFSVPTAGWLNWSAFGAVLLILLFQGSAAFSEGVSAQKYPEYRIYQAQVPIFVPWPWLYKPIWQWEKEE